MTTQCCWKCGSQTGVPLVPKQRAVTMEDGVRAWVLTKVPSGSVRECLNDACGEVSQRDDQGSRNILNLLETSFAGLPRPAHMYPRGGHHSDDDSDDDDPPSHEFKVAGVNSGPQATQRQVGGPTSVFHIKSV